MFYSKNDRLNWAYVSGQLLCDDFSKQIWLFLGGRGAAVYSPSICGITEV